MTPPQLAGNTPVLNIAHPLEIGFFPMLWHKADITTLHRLNRRLSQLFNRHIPLIGQIRLNHSMGTVTATDLVRMRFNLVKQTFSFQIGNHALTRFVTVQPLILLGNKILGVDMRRVGENITHRQVVTLAHFIVIKIVGRCDFHTTGSKLGIHICIGNHRDGPIAQWQNQLPANQIPVTFIIRMHRHGTITEQGFRTCCGHNHVFGRIIRIRILNMPEVTLFLFMLHFQIGNSGFQHRIPVHQTLATINQPFFEQADKHFLHRMG